MKNKASSQTISEMVVLFDCIINLADVGIEGIEYFEDAQIICIKNRYGYSDTINLTRASNAEILRRVVERLEIHLNANWMRIR